MQYFSQDGRVLTEDEALGPGGIMRDGVVCRIRLTMRDADYALHRPGFRSGNGGTFADYLARDDRRESYKDYDAYITEAYRKPPRADAAVEEEDDADDDGAISAADAKTSSSDRRSVAQMMQDHQRCMQSVYNSYAEEISQAWKASDGTSS